MSAVTPLCSRSGRAIERHSRSAERDGMIPPAANDGSIAAPFGRVSKRGVGVAVYPCPGSCRRLRLDKGDIAVGGVRGDERRKASAGGPDWLAVPRCTSLPTQSRAEGLIIVSVSS